MEWCMFLFAVCVLISEFQVSVSSRITLNENGYEGIVIALPPQVGVKDQISLVSNLKILLEHSSKILASSTKDRASFRSVTFLIPPEWGTSWYASFEDNSTTFEEAGATTSRETADVFVFYSFTSEHPYTLHHETCTHQGVRIYMSSRFLLEKTMQEISVEFLRLWSEFRYGMFPEGGFENDIKYPYRYTAPGETESQVTGCAAQSFEIPFECTEKANCTEDAFTSSLMDQHLSSSATFFCEGEFSLGPAHNPHSPSKQNLLCKEEGTWHTLMRSQDFAKGKNPALKHRRNTEMKFQFVQEVSSPKVVAVIETSAKMNLESRYSLIKNAFSHFVYTTLPKGSELTLMTFDGENGVQLLKTAVRLSNDEEKVQFLEGQPLLEDTSSDGMACVECVLDHIFELMNDNQTDFPRSPVIILVTSACSLSSTRYPDVKEKLLDLEVRLHVLSFGKCEENDGETALTAVCSETHGSFIHISGDILGDLYKGFHNAIHSRNKEIMVFQEYLSTEDEETLSLSFNIENRMFEKVRVYISGPDLNTGALVFEKTELTCPPVVVPSFRKQEILPAWIFDVNRPIIGGTYNLTTERKRGAKSPILVTVSVQQMNSEDQLNVRAWTEMFYAAEISPPPVRVFAEVRKGVYPIAGAKVSAKILHPDGGLSEFLFIDDGLGNADITKDDGIYSHYFTNFTSPGFYNVYIKVERINENETAEVRGPDGYCCGTSFRGTLGPKMASFQREAGPVSFHVSSIPVSDVYPPSRVMDLSLINNYDQIYVLNWTAVGDDYDTGVASEYELKLFPDRTVIRHRFNGSGLELYEERIETTPLAQYGRQLIHTFGLPKLKRAGLYYFAIRAIDEAGNAGEPSNALPVWIEQARNSSAIDCSPDETPKPEKYNEANCFAPFVSLILCMLILRHF
ncbi:calcium-activated chloride channel regulator 2-like [Uloborus diversus]|uniref:calcium-activated chloride channel regulator 2-like n=1 Tax=Uloborus diversus TaxID=327109 RepID=UPI0024092A66|nr:calcium-activated chloride channel regulator 2-like [Uloborus diversus]